MNKQTEKAREAKVRRELKKQGYILEKSRAHNWTIDNQQGYKIIDASMNVVCSGENYNMKIEDVEKYIEGEREED